MPIPSPYLFVSKVNDRKPWSFRRKYRFFIEIRIFLRRYGFFLRRYGFFVENTDFSSKIRIFSSKIRIFFEKADFFVIPLANRAGALRTPPNARLLFFVSRDESSVGADFESKNENLFSRILFRRKKRVVARNACFRDPDVQSGWGFAYPPKYQTTFFLLAATRAL